MVTVSLEAKPDKRRITMLLTVAGQAEQEIYSTFTFEDAGDSDKYDKVIELFEAYCTPHINDIYERYVFRMRFCDRLEI